MTDFERFRFAWGQNKNEVELGLEPESVWCSKHIFLIILLCLHKNIMYNRTYADKWKCCFLPYFCTYFFFLQLYFFGFLRPMLQSRLFPYYILRCNIHTILCLLKHPFSTNQSYNYIKFFLFVFYAQTSNSYLWSWFYPGIVQMVHKATFPKEGKRKEKKMEKFSCAVNLNTFGFSLFTCYK